MKKIRDRLRLVRAKLARVTRAWKIAELRCNHFAAQYRHAKAEADRHEAAGERAAARRARHRQHHRRDRLKRWRRRKDWLLGKKRFLTAAEKQWIANKVQWLKDHPQPTTGWTTWNGVSIAAWMEPWLVKSKAAGWTGTVVSGVRTPEYSEQLCFNMCGAPSCPGRCAGRSSNHNCTAGCPYPTGAIDVTDYSRFGQIQYEIGSPLRNHLPIDPVHYSVSGF